MRTASFLTIVGFAAVTLVGTGPRALAEEPAGDTRSEVPALTALHEVVVPSGTRPGRRRTTR